MATDTADHPNTLREGTNGIAPAARKATLHERPQEKCRPQRREDQDENRQGSQSLSLSRTLTSSKQQVVDTARLAPLGIR